MLTHRPTDFTIDADFPGGNIIVDSIVGDIVRLRQDRRTTTEWWFYWHFRVRNAGGRTIRFEFTDGDVFTAAGPCYSADGHAWQWLGREVVVNNGFSFSFPAGQSEGHFSLGIPYVERDLNAFLATRPAIQRETLTRTEQGREAELLRLISTTGRRLVCLCARTHACEAVASLVLEGMLDFWLSDDSPDGTFLREQVDLVVFPLVDKDGVEAGDQGKLRAPHDHNRDYTDQPLYAVTPAIQGELRRNAGRLVLGLDLHCPWIRGKGNEDAYLVGPPPPRDVGVIEFSKLIEETRRGDIPWSHANFLPHNTSWNVGTPPMLAFYIGGLPSVAFAATLEIPYGVCGGVIMTADRAREFGRDVGRAVARLVQRRN